MVLAFDKTIGSTPRRCRTKVERRYKLLAIISLLTQQSPGPRILGQCMQDERHSWFDCINRTVTTRNSSLQRNFLEMAAPLLHHVFRREKCRSNVDATKFADGRPILCFQSSRPFGVKSTSRHHVVVPMMTSLCCDGLFSFIASSQWQIQSHTFTTLP